jgi:hypothetical protein
LVDQDGRVNADLDLIEARWRIGLITPSDLRGVASELLDRGVSADSLIELFSLPIDAAIWNGSALFERALTELRGGQMPEAEAALVVAADIARGVLSGALEPSRATALAASIHSRTEYRFDDFRRLSFLDDEMSYFDKSGKSHLGRTGAVVAEDVRIEARRILGAYANVPD